MSLATPRCVSFITAALVMPLALAVYKLSQSETVKNMHDWKEYYSSEASRVLVGWFLFYYSASLHVSTTGRRILYMPARSQDSLFSQSFFSSE